MKISVIGCGWYGTPLAHSLRAKGHTVYGSTTTPEKQLVLQKDLDKVFLLDAPLRPEAELLNSDILVLNIPPFEGQLDWFKQWKFSQDTWMIFISSTSGSLTDQEDWVREKFKNWTVLRFAGLIGNGRHPVKSLSGKKNLKGKNWPVNLLHQDDAVGFTECVIKKKIQHEMIEVLCDEHHTREIFYTEAANRMNLPLPEFDQNDQSQKKPIDNKRAKEIYTFKFPTMLGTSL